MKKLVAFGIAAFLLFALVTLPASVVLSLINLQGVTLSGVSGSIWNGRAEAVRAGTLNVGSVEWNLDVLALFTGKLGANVKVTRTDGFAQGAVAFSGSSVTLRRVNDVPGSTDAQRHWHIERIDLGS